MNRWNEINKADKVLSYIIYFTLEGKYNFIFTLLYTHNSGRTKKQITDESSNRVYTSSSAIPEPERWILFAYIVCLMNCIPCHDIYSLFVILRHQCTTYFDIV